MSLLTAIKTQAQITDTVLISFSMGKDSIATMDLCFKYFKRVQPFFMYMVPNLEFQEEALGKYERHYNTKIIRVPHFETSNFYRYGSLLLISIRKWYFPITILKSRFIVKPTFQRMKNLSLSIKWNDILKRSDLDEPTA